MLNAQSVESGKPFFTACVDLLCRLWSRWQDEKEYENIADYAGPLQQHAKEAGVRIVRMSKVPFGVIYVTPDGEEYLAYVKSRTCGYRRVG